jgi:hypothetical protein
MRYTAADLIYKLRPVSHVRRIQRKEHEGLKIVSEGVAYPIRRDRVVYWNYDNFP